MFRADFVYRACLRTAVPVLWSYDSRPEIVLGQRQPATLRELRGAETMVKVTGLRGGVSVPVRGPGSTFGYVVFMSAHRLEVLRACYQDYYDLSARELECLALIAVGKTLDEAAEILGLSYSTVRFHLRNAESKLGTWNRAQAIAKATFLGLLGPLD